jgi:translation elongation factor P/translation initiation factor 5A
VTRKRSDFKIIFEKHKELVTAVMAKMSTSLISSEAFHADDLMDEAELSREITLVLQSMRDLLGG